MIISLLLAAALPGTAELTRSGDLSLQMVQGIDSYLARQLAAAQGPVGTRERFRHIIGLRDRRVSPVALERRGLLTSTAAHSIYAVRWPVFEGVDGEGLLVEPSSKVVSNLVVLPDADQTPEQVAEASVREGVRVLIPVLIDRKDTWSGNPEIGRMTNQPHREYIYRMAFQAGRHIIGYEVQKVLAAVDWFGMSLPVAVSGYGEGGLIALYAGVADERIGTVTVGGYFRDRRRVFREPIYRNVWGLLPSFGDAELARLIHPRKLIIEARVHPAVAGPPAEQRGRAGAAPGLIDTPLLEEVRGELARAGTVNAVLVENPPSTNATVSLPVAGPERMERQFRQLVRYTQSVVRASEKERKKYWANADLSSEARWSATRAYYDEQFSAELLGKLPVTAGPLRVETRKIYDTQLFEGWEVYQPVLDEVFSYGVLLVPRGLKAGERRPLVIAQHGLEGRPQEIVAPTQPGQMLTYQRFAARLAERGFIVYAPQNPYIHGGLFRELSRKGDPLGLNLFAFVRAQYARSLDWLETLAFVDKDRIGFYGLSYGGYTAMRIPPLEPRIKAVICSGNFNEWSWKVTSDEATYSYQFTREYEIGEFNQTNTFGHAEMAALIAPRPFFVERGHDDGVGIDEWVSYEFAKVRRMYAKMGRADAAEIEYFNGVHQIWGNGAFSFLHRWLRWP